MRILYIAGNPEGEATLQVEAEISALQREVDDSPSSQPLELRVYSHLRIDELPSTIARIAPDVIHFAAHGDQDAIVLMDGDGRAVRLSGERLADLLRAIDVRPGLIVINACSSADMAAGMVGAADFVIGTDAEISNDAARTMAATLYQRLARGSSVLAAFEAAQTMLGIVSGDTVSTTLFPTGSEELARRRALIEPLRIIARLPTLDDALEQRRRRVPAGYGNADPVIQFGVAGASPTARQLVLFTDDETVTPDLENGETLESVRSWIVECRSTRSEMWTTTDHAYWGDMDWYAAVVSVDGKIACASSTTCRALSAYYLEEEWRGTLPPAFLAAVRLTIAKLGSHDGARRRRAGGRQ